MQSVSLDESALGMFPETEIRLVAAYGLDNGVVWQETVDKVASIENELANHTWLPFTEDDPQIQSWHSAFRQFGTNPRRLRCSLDALSRRIAKSGAFPRINPAVDTYNYVSVLFGTPAGAFDLSAFDPSAVGGDEIVVRRADGTETFTPLGEPDKIEHPNVGEVVYLNNGRVLTRHWNYRDCDQTKVDASSTDVLFILERVSAAAVPSATLADAHDVLVDIVAPRSTGLFKATLNAASPAALLPTRATATHE